MRGNSSSAARSRSEYVTFHPIRRMRGSPLPRKFNTSRGSVMNQRSESDGSKPSFGRTFRADCSAFTLRTW